MFDKEITKLEKEIDELSPKLEFLERQMREKVKKLRDYQEAYYRHELGLNRSRYHADKNFPKHLMDYPDKYIHKRTSFNGEVRYFLNESQIIRDNGEKNRKRFKKERGYESP